MKKLLFLLITFIHFFPFKLYANNWEGVVNGKSIIITDNGVIQDGKLRKIYQLSDNELCIYGNTNFPKSPPNYNFHRSSSPYHAKSWSNRWRKEFRLKLEVGKVCDQKWKVFISSASISEESTTVINKVYNHQKKTTSNTTVDDEKLKKFYSSMSDTKLCSYIGTGSAYTNSGLYEYDSSKAAIMLKFEIVKRNLPCATPIMKEYYKDKTVTNQKFVNTSNRALNLSDENQRFIKDIKEHQKNTGDSVWNNASDSSLCATIQSSTSSTYQKKRASEVLTQRGITCKINRKDKSKLRTIKNLSNSIICFNATIKLGDTKIWNNTNSRFVDEANERELSCNVNNMDEEVCTKATVAKRVPGTYNYVRSWNKNYSYYVKEAKIKGLDCGVKDDEVEKKKIAEEKARKEKERQAELEREERIKAEQEKIKKKAEEVARKKRLKEEKVRKTKLAEEKARKKKLAEQERKRKLAQEKLNKKIKDYKRKAENFYKDIENFVKSGGNVDLVKLSDFFDIKPNPRSKWNKSDLSRYEELRNFMVSIPQFVSFEKDRIGKRLKNSFAIKDQSIEELEKNLSELKGLMRKMFGSSEIPKIKQMVKDIQSTLSNFKQATANKVLKQSSTYIANKLPKPKVDKRTTEVTTSLDTNWTKVRNDLTIQQQQFCQLTDRFYGNLNKARKSKNEIKVNIVHKERQENLDALIPEGKISNWIFKVIKIDQVEDGSAAVVLGLQCKSYVGSGQTVDVKKGMSKEDKKQWRATIPYNDRRFRELAKLDQGQFIVGSGTMLEINAYKPGQIETFYASQQIGEHPLTKGLNLEGELFIADLSYIAALN